MSRKQHVFVFKCSYNFGGGIPTQTLISARNERTAAERYAEFEFRVDGSYVVPEHVLVKPANEQTNENGFNYEISFRKTSFLENIFGTNGEIVKGIDSNYVKIVKELNDQL